MEHPPWTLPGVEGKKARGKGKKSDSFNGNLSVEHPPWTLPGVEGKKAKGKGKKIPTHFRKFQCGTPSMDTAWGRRKEIRKKKGKKF